MLKRTSIGSQTHMNWNGITSRISPIWNAWWNFPICHVFLSQFSRRWSKQLWRRRPWSSWQFPMLMHWRHQWIDLNSINTSNSLFIKLPVLSFCCKFNHFRWSISQFCHLSCISSLLLDPQNLIYFFTSCPHWFLICFGCWLLQFRWIDVPIFEIVGNFAMFFGWLDNHVIRI